MVAPLTAGELEGLRRSAAMAPLSPASLERLFDGCAGLLAEQAKVRAALDRLSGPFADVRAVLNELHHVTNRPPGPPRRAGGLPAGTGAFEPGTLQARRSR